MRKLESRERMDRRALHERNARRGITSCTRHEQWIVELRDHDPWNCPVRERDLRGLARPLELGCHTEVDVFVGKSCARARACATPRSLNGQGTSALPLAIPRALMSAHVRCDQQVAPGLVD
jgi:hypothetical protein